mmetsp:Transcript_38070/g.49982  ORF Transcript_38070/g.49982 Transcript_38070/m.49982 type:complete len:99 (-) Transcript_38070:537-833(-)
MYSLKDYKLIKELYNQAIDDILEEMGGFPDVKLSNLPSYRTSKNHILKKIPKLNDMQMVPKLPENLKNDETGEDFDKAKISTGYLDAKKQKKIYQMIN